MNPLSFIGDIARAVAAIFGFAQKKTELNNTPEMQNAAQAQKQNNQKDDDAKAIANGDVDAVSNKLSE